MKTAASQLEQTGYRLLSCFSLDDLIGLVLRELKHRTPHVAAFWVASIASGVTLGIGIGTAVAAGVGWYVVFTPILGLVGMLIAIPLHEFTHGVFFRLIGARRVRYGMHLRQAMFYAVAPGFAGARGEMLPVLYSPTVIISAALVVAAFVSDPIVGVSALWVLFFHTTSCIGDFAVASYMWRHRNRGIVICDDADRTETLFYVRSDYEPR